MIQQKNICPTIGNAHTPKQLKLRSWNFCRLFPQSGAFPIFRRMHFWEVLPKISQTKRKLKSETSCSCWSCREWWSSYMWQVTHNIWHKTHEKRHKPNYTWHITHFFLSSFCSDIFVPVLLSSTSRDSMCALFKIFHNWYLWM